LTTCYVVVADLIKILTFKTDPEKQIHMPTVEYLNYEVLDDYGWELYDPELFEKATAEELDEEDHGIFELDEDDWLLDHAMDEGHDWPFSCQTGACANCAAIILEGEVDMHNLQQILMPDEVEEKNVRLTCIATPETDTVKLVFNAKHINYLRNRVVR